LSAKDIISDLKKGKIAPVYILHGEEPFYIDQVSDWIEDHLLDEASRAFNQIVLYGKEADARLVIDEARQYPMMSQRRLIIIKEAADMKTINDLTDYIKKPVPHSTVVLCHKYKKIDKRTSFGKAADGAGIVVLESKKMYDNQLPNWVMERSRELNLQVDDKIANLLAEYLGNDLNKIDNELSKIKLNVGENKKVTVEEVQELVGMSKEYNVFELQSALAQKDIYKSWMMANYFAENPKAIPIQMAVSSLYGYFLKVLIAVQSKGGSDMEMQKALGLSSPFFVKEYRMAAGNFNEDHVRAILIKLKEIDLKSKGVMNRHSEDGPLYKDLVRFVLKK